MRRLLKFLSLVTVTATLLMLGHWFPENVLAIAPPPGPTLGTWGVDTTAMDPSVHPGDDFFSYANGTWVEAAEIPTDQSAITMFSQLRQQVAAQIETILDEATANAANAPSGSNVQKIGDWYATLLNENQLEAQGLAELQPEFERINAIADRDDLVSMLGENNGTLNVPFLRTVVNPHPQNSEAFIPWISASTSRSLSMGQAVFYLDPAYDELRQQHQAHMARLLTLAEVSNPTVKAANIQALETKMALTERPIDSAAYGSPVSRSELLQRFPTIDWSLYLATAGVADAPLFGLAQPEALAEGLTLINTEPIETWQAYFTYQALKTAAPYLPSAFRAETFDFYQRVLQEQPDLGMPDPRSQANDNVQKYLPFPLAELYVERYVNPETKATAEAMVADLIEAFDQRLQALSWMSPETKQFAREKLAKTTWKIGYPDPWPNYSDFEVVPGEPLGNVQRATRFSWQLDLEQLTQPRNRDSWRGLSPLGVGATADPTQTQVAAAIAILQPPFFDPLADAAANYGGIGAVLAHELSHLFDGIGRQFDADGTLRNWWTPTDSAQFEALTAQLSQQVSTYEVLPGKFVDGELTLNESIADLGGISIAYDAYQQSLNGQPAPIIDGFTGAQRFFLAWSQNWRSKHREGETANRLITDTHPPQSVRPLSVRNLAAWYDAFEVTAEHELYLPESERITIW